ncbi:MAG: serine/threonine protein kinase [Candidatus Promineifilaceae bacterium]
MSIQPNDRIGNYTVNKLLSDAGGMSSVYLAERVDNPKRKVALKVALSSNVSAFQDLLRDETRVLSKLRHPGLIRVYSEDVNGRFKYAMRAIRHEDRPWYYAMEYIPGLSLEGLKSRIRRFPLEWKIELFYQILTTIDYMHKMGYAHCDLKPANILFRRTPRINELPLPVLVDFGSASPVKQIKEKIATVRYASPEIIHALSDPNPKSHLGIRADKLDIWELGVLLYEIVTGEALFRGNTRRIKTTILRGEIKRMSDTRLEINPSLDKLLSVMMRQNPNERPSTNAIIQAIEERISSIHPPRIDEG